MRPRTLKKFDHLPSLTKNDKKYLEENRPRTREECINGPRPCPWVGCRYNLYLDLNSKGSIKINFPGKGLKELPETCALDIIQKIGEFFNVSTEAARLMEKEALNKMDLYMEE